MSLDYFQKLPYDFEPHDPLTPFLDAVIDRERAKIAPAEAVVAPLVSGLAQRLQKRQEQLRSTSNAQQYMPSAPPIYCIQLRCRACPPPRLTSEAVEFFGGYVIGLSSGWCGGLCLLGECSGKCPKSCHLWK